ncbi:hypothetical protein J7E95_40130 [Streptomyces sp. ISL-14]|nr:hypothetical protein [Streptomyces sp. ISL-14]
MTAHQDVRAHEHVPGLIPHTQQPPGGTGLRGAPPTPAPPDRPPADRVGVSSQGGTGSGVCARAGVQQRGGVRSARASAG